MHDEKDETEVGAVDRLKEALAQAIGENAPYPTPEEMCCHKQRGEQQ